jgi:hypothetical protein
MRKIKDVLPLKLEARLSHERIAEALGISKGVVAKYTSLAAWVRRGHALLRWRHAADRPGTIPAP